MNLFYHSLGFALSFFEVEEEETRHLRVLRMKDGESIWFTDGKGNRCKGSMEWKKHKAFVHFEEVIFEEEKTPKLALVICPTKNSDRMEWLIEKAVEIGIHSVHCILCENSERPVFKTERLKKVAISAMKQSLKCYLPEINELRSFSDFIKNPPFPKGYIAHCKSDRPRLLLKNALDEGQDSFICIGPEGDFTTKEIEAARMANCLEVSLGESRLRTETAGLVAVHTFELRNQK
jgi:16S rRNA (uracil1498-N3)-methyltransferase